MNIIMISVACLIGIPLSIVLTIFAIKFASKVDSFLADLVDSDPLLGDVVKVAAKNFIGCMLTFTFAIVTILTTFALIIFA